MRERNSKRLENGKIQFSKDFEKRLDTICIQKPLFEIYDKPKIRIKTIKNTKEFILRKFSKAVQLQNEYSILPCTKCIAEIYRRPALFGPLKNIEIQRLDANQRIYSKNVKTLVAIKNKLTKQLNKLEQELLLSCQNAIYRTEIFPEIEVYMEDLYEKLYKVVENNLKQEKSKEIEAKAELKKQISKYNAKLEKER